MDRFALKQITGPAGLAMSVDTLKEELGITDTGQDAALARLIAEATAFIESATGRCLITQTWAESLDCFPWELLAGLSYELHLAPVTSISSITYVDTAGATQTWASTNYQVDTAAEPARVSLALGGSVPTTEIGRLSAVAITYTVGYGSAESDMPEAAIALICEYCRPRYERRPPTADEIRRQHALLSELSYTL